MAALVVTKAEPKTVDLAEAEVQETHTAAEAEAIRVVLDQVQVHTTAVVVDLTAMVLSQTIN
jgi:hypothetical protein